MSSYGALLARPTARALACACATAWLAFASVTLALVLLVRSSGGSALAAGAVVAAYAVAAALLAPLRGRVVERGGPQLLPMLAASHAVALLLVAVAAAAGAPAAAVAALAAGAGGSAPPLIAVARALWPRVAGPALTRAGYALTALLGDAGGVLGPPAAAALATTAGPAAALGAVALAPLAAALALRRLATNPTSVTSHVSEKANVTEMRGALAWLVAADVGAGACVGAIELALPARAGSAGALPLAAFAAASMTAAWWSGRRDRTSPRRRLTAGLALLAAGSALVLAGAPAAADALAAASPIAAVIPAGAGYGLLTVALLELLDEVAPAGRQVEAFTWLTSAHALGLAAGSLAAGVLV